MVLNYPLLLLIFVAIYTLQKVIFSAICSLNNQVKKFIKLQKDNEKFAKSSSFQIEVQNFELLHIKKEYLGFITKIIGYFESIFFIILTVITFQYSTLNYSFIFSVAGVWIGLKIFGSYQQWSGVVLGRATFYIFLIGSILNIMGSIMLGFIYYHNY